MMFWKPQCALSPRLNRCAVRVNPRGRLHTREVSLSCAVELLVGIPPARDGDTYPSMIE